MHLVLFPHGKLDTVFHQLGAGSEKINKTIPWKGMSMQYSDQKNEKCIYLNPLTAKSHEELPGSKIVAT